MQAYFRIWPMGHGYAATQALREAINENRQHWAGRFGRLTASTEEIELDIQASLLQRGFNVVDRRLDALEAASGVTRGMPDPSCESCGPHPIEPCSEHMSDDQVVRWLTDQGYSPLRIAEWFARNRSEVRS